MFNLFLRPFAYLTIKHGDPLRHWVNWYLPGFISVLVMAAWTVPLIASKLGFVSPSSVNIWGDKGLISGILAFVQNLPGFYTAALAAVATFGGNEMNREMPGEAPKMRFLVEGQLTEPLPLSRRLFLTSMFAYLTILSFLLTLVAIVGTSLADPIGTMLVPMARSVVCAIATGLFTLFFAQLLFVTAWGLYYLGERMHLTSGPQDAA